MSKIIERVLKSKNIEYYFLTLILIFGLLVRLYKIQSPIADWHSWRQSDTASVSKSFVERGINLLKPSYQDISSIQTGIFNPQGLRLVEFPIFNAIHALLFKNIGKFSFEVWGRLTSIFSVLVSSVLIFFLGKRFIGKWGGTLASFFFLFIPYNIYFGRVILPEPLSVTFALFSLWLFVKFIDTEKLWQLYLSGVFFALGTLIKPSTFFYIVPILYLAIDKYSLLGIFKNFKLLIWADIAFIPFFLWRVWINNWPAGIPFFEWAFNGDKIRFRPSFWWWIFGERIGKLILGFWGLIPFSFGIITTVKKNIFNLLFFIGSILYVFTLATANVRHDYYQIYLIPPISLLLAQGTISMWKGAGVNKILSRLILVFASGMMFLAGAYQIKEFYKINHPEIIVAGKAIDRIAPKDALVIAPYNGDTAFLYQTGRWGWPAVDDSLEKIIKKGADYFVSVNFADPDTTTVMKKFETIERTETYVIVDLNKPKAK